LYLKPAYSSLSDLKKPALLPDTLGIMTTACTQTLYAPNPPQLEEPWLKAALLIIALVLLAAVVLGS
jgi:hypothetical protein